jgi:N-acyl homoserine lactone hydrolase
VNSHLHFDHTGGNALLPNARIVIQRREWEAGRNPELMKANGYDPLDYDLGQPVLQVEGDHDLFGDGSVVMFPTYGHTPGHQSLRLKLDSGDVVLTGDACYFKQTLDELHLPKIVHDRADMLRSLEILRQLRAAGARIFYGHDPEFWREVPQAPMPVS